jgi:beta-mannosidase
MLIYQDFPLQWGYSASKKFIEDACSQIKDMVRHLFNHPSVVIWCCHNEPIHTRSKLDIKLYRTVTETDKTRYVVQSSLLTEHAYPGWYYGNYREFSGMPAGPLVTEFGAQAIPNKESLRRYISKEDLWPPNWDVWAYHNFRYTQTFDVAGVKRGRSLAEFIRNSQQYQAELLKFAIETMRRGKYRKITGLFQFMFVDCWPSISWSVVDCYRQPKKGFYALKAAYQPILPSIDIKRRPIAVFSIINNIGRTCILWDPRQVIWVTNDTHKNYKNAKIMLKVEDGKGKVYLRKAKTINIPKDSSVPVIRPTRFKPILNIKGELPENIYVLRMEIYYRKKKISENYELFRIISKQQI